MSWPGGKNGAGIPQRIISQIPPHRRFISGCAGHCAVTRWKRPADHTVLIDPDPDVIAWWKLRAASQPSGIFEPPPPPRKRRGSVAGDSRLTTTRYSAAAQVEFVCEDVTEWLANASCSPLFATYPSADFLYLDPPYPLAVRSAGRKYYDAEMSDSQHYELLALLRKIRCRVLIHCYPCHRYAAALAGWRTFTYRAMTRGGMRTEQVWCNYDAPDELHDYRWIGRDKRERCKLARRCDNLVRWLADLPSLERRQALAAVDAEFCVD